MRMLTRRLAVAAAAIGVAATAACGVGDRSREEHEGGDQVGVTADAPPSECPGSIGRTRAAAIPKGWGREEVVLDGEPFVVRMPPGWTLIDESDSSGEGYALVADDMSAGVALAAGTHAEEVRQLVALSSALADIDGKPKPAPVAFAGGRGCRTSLVLDESGEVYEVWLADGDRPIGALAVGVPGAAWRDVPLVVASLEPNDA